MIHLATWSKLTPRVTPLCRQSEPLTLADRWTHREADVTCPACRVELGLETADVGDAETVPQAKTSVLWKIFGDLIGCLTERNRI